MRTPSLTVTIHDCEVQTFRGSGAGGQNRNKRDTGVRVIHEPSGARGESCEQRSQLQNKKTAFKRMAETPAFRAWAFAESGYSPRVVAQVDRALWPANLKIERRINGRWVEVDE